ncbi:MAG: complex I subunit 5 family protein [Spirochaetia bacterium]|nr:complex I subunit 5 family protein [Spirochaetia bacterium]
MNPQSELPVLIILFAPLIAAILSLVGKFLPPRYSITPAFLVWLGGSLWAIYAAAPAILYGQSLEYSLGGWAEPYGISLSINGLTWIATLTDIVIASAAWLATRRYTRFGALFYFFFFMALFSLQGVLCSRDIFNLFVWFEVLSLSSFILISYDRSLSSRLAAIRYLLISSLSITFFLIGVWILYRLTGSLALTEIAEGLQSLNSAAETRAFAGAPPFARVQSAAGLALALITAAILTRAAVTPFHTWLPDAHTAAPYPVSALLSGFVIKAPMIALWRIFELIEFPQLMEGLVWLGGVTAVWGVAAAMLQKDAKKLLGYHSVSQMGYILAAFGIGGVLGRSAALFYIIAHALFKSLLFLTVGHVTTRVGTRNVYKIRGLRRFFPFYTIAFLIAAASISGLPLLAGFTGKVLVSEALHSHPAYLMLLAAGVGTAASFVKLSAMFFGKASDAHLLILESRPADDRGSKTAAGEAHFGLLVIAAGCIAMGVIPHLIHHYILLLLHGRAALPPPIEIDWYNYASLLKAGVSIGGGFLLALFLLSPFGKGLAHRARTLRVGLNGSLRMLVSGFVLVLLYGLLTY